MRKHTNLVRKQTITNEIITKTCANQPLVGMKMHVFYLRYHAFNELINSFNVKHWFMPGIWDKACDNIGKPWYWTLVSRTGHLHTIPSFVGHLGALNGLPPTPPTILSMGVTARRCRFSIPRLTRIERRGKQAQALRLVPQGASAPDSVTRSLARVSAPA